MARRRRHHRGAAAAVTRGPNIRYHANELTMSSASVVTLTCADLCQRVYEVDEDALFHAAENGSGLFIAIEGSDSLQNWYDNASFAFKRGNVHRGFSRYARFIETTYDLKKRISSFENVVITGHSLGAAAAVLVAYNMRELLREKNSVDVVIFGAPKIGGRDFVARFHAQCDFINLQSFATDFDVIPRLPIAMGYEILISPTYLRSSAFRIFVVTNHSMRSYIRALHDLVSQN